MARSPLFDYYDPYGLLEQQAQMGLLPPDEEDVDEYGMPRQRTKPTLSDLMPAEQKSSLLGKLANAGASGLTGLGWLLDTPGAFVRGTISGLMDGDPLKGARGILAPSDERVSGRELLRQAGMVGNEDTWGNFIGGLAGEIVTDPFLYLNPLAMLGKGASSAAGRTMARAGLLDDVKVLARRQGKGTRELMRQTPDQLFASNALPNDSLLKFQQAARGRGLDAEKLLKMPMAGVMEARIPGMEMGKTFSLGETGDWLARTLDNFGEGLATNRFTAPVANRFTRAFDGTVLNRLDRGEQWMAREAVSDARKLGRDQKEQLAQYWLGARKADVSALPESLQKFDSDRIQAAIRDSLEAKLDPERMAQLVDQEAIQAVSSVPEWREYRQWLADSLETAQARRNELGLVTPTAQSLYDTGYMPSQRYRFPQEQTIPTPPGKTARAATAYERGQRVFSLDDLVGKGRNPALDLERRSETLRRLMSGDDGVKLRDRLYGASDTEMPGIIDEAFQTLGLEAPYSRLRGEKTGSTAQEIMDLLADPSLSSSERLPLEAELKAIRGTADRQKNYLGDLLRTVDPQFAAAGKGLFDRHTAEDILRYGIGGARSEGNSKVVLESLINAASDIPANQMTGGGAVPLMEAAQNMGFNPSRLKEILEKRMPGRDVASLSIPQQTVKDLMAIAPRSAEDPASLLGQAWDSYTNAFKIGALANPAYHTRNQYSGFLSSLASGEFDPIGLMRSFYAGNQAGRGNYGPLARRLEGAPAFRGMSSADERVAEFLTGAARNDLGQGQVMEGASRAPNILVGEDTMEPLRLFGEQGLLYDPKRTWKDWRTVRGVDFPGMDRPPPGETLNPFLRLHERVSRRVEDANRIGTYLEAVRRGASPDAAAELVYKTQVNYAPEAFTEFERKLKKIVPFYSWTRGITPFIAENLLYRPGGLQGQVTRAISNVSRPNEEFFTPEHLRQSASIPLPFTAGNEGQLQRYLTNVDVPWEGPVNLISPGTGNNVVERLSSGIQKTGMNLLGQLNPLIKAPLEMLMDRQLYTGREMSDLYSMLEQGIGPIGRPLEQLIVNAPGGSRAVSIARTALDNRMSPSERALKLLVNNFAGVKLTDVDQERTRSLAARNTLNELLRTTGGVRTYENITVPDEALANLPPEQRDLYLLYRIIQSDAAKRSRQRKKAEGLADPMAILGIR